MDWTGKERKGLTKLPNPKFQIRHNDNGFDYLNPLTKERKAF